MMQHTLAETYPMTPENTPGIEFVRDGVPNIARLHTGFWENLINGIECSLVFKGDRVYLVTNNPKGLTGSARVK